MLKALLSLLSCNRLIHVFTRAIPSTQTGHQTLYSYTLPANAIGKGLKIIVWGDSTYSDFSKMVYLFVGESSPASVQSANAQGWRLEVSIFKDASGLASIGHGIASNGHLPASTSIIIDTPKANPTAPIDISLQCNTGAIGSVTFRGMSVEALN